MEPVAVFENESHFKISNKKGFSYTLLKATAGLAKLCLKYIKSLFRNSFVHLADEEGLANFAKEYGVKLKTPTPARIKVEVKNIELPVIPISTTFKYKSLKFLSIQTQDVVNKKAIVEAVSEEPGLIQNLRLYTPLEIEEMLD